MPEIKIPSDFNAVILTAPPEMTKDTLPKFLAMIEASGAKDSPGNRIFHFHQVEHVDSAAVAQLISVIGELGRRGLKLIICDPPPMVRSFFKIYGLTEKMDEIIVGSSKDGTYKYDGENFLPPFVPEPAGRIDIYKNGKAKSFRLGDRHVIPVDPVDLSSHPTKAPARAKVMMVQNDNEQEELKSKAYVMLRNHACGCDHTHAIFDSIYSLHNWYRNKGFDFVDLKLWASDEPAGYIVEEVTFRDQQHFNQFKTMLKIDESWKKLLLKEEYVSDQFFYVY
ncbi:MAG: STAS domain-containing protein [Planctomycetota bacterium]